MIVLPPLHDTVQHTLGICVTLLKSRQVVRKNSAGGSRISIRRRPVQGCWWNVRWTPISGLARHLTGLWSRIFRQWNLQARTPRKC